MKPIARILLTFAAPLVVVTLYAESQPSGQIKDVGAAFEERYEAWQQYTRKPELWLSSDLSVYWECPAFERIVLLGPPALPHIVAKIEPASKGFNFLNIAVGRIAKRKFAQKQDLLEWWRGGEEATAQEYDTLSQKWRALKGEKYTLLWTTETTYYAPADEIYTRRRDMTEAGEVYQAIEDFGLAVLPHIVADLRAGKYDFLQTAIQLTDRRAPVTLEALPVLPEVRAERFLAWWEENKEQWTIPWPDERPAP